MVSKPQSVEMTRLVINQKRGHKGAITKKPTAITSAIPSCCGGGIGRSPFKICTDLISERVNWNSESVPKHRDDSFGHQTSKNGLKGPCDKIRQHLVPPSPLLHRGSAGVLGKALSRPAQTVSQGATTGMVN